MNKFLRLYRDPGTGDGAGGTTTVTVDNTTPPAGGAYTPPSIDMNTAVPPEFRDHPAIKGKDFVSVIKEHVNVQKLLGQRPQGIPAETASDEEWGKFIDTLRPKDLNEYQFPETDWAKSNKRSPEYEKAMREILAEMGVSKKFAGKGIAKIEAFLAEGQKANEAQKVAAEKARHDEFEKLLDTSFGTQKQAVLDRTKKLMAESVPAEMQAKVAAVLKDIPNDQLFVLTSVLNGIHAKYIAEDTLPGGGDNAGADAASLQAEAETIMKSNAYRDFRDPGHDAAKQKVQSLFGQIAAMKKV